MVWFRPRFAVAGLVAVLVLAGSLSLATAPAAHACSCPLPPPPGEAMESAEEVFRGEVLDITRPDYGGDVTVQFAVSEAWKGVDHQEIEIATPPSSASCGFAFEVGQEYLVYTYEYQKSGDSGPETGTGLCHRTAALADAGEDLDVLGEGSPGEDLSPADAGETGDDDEGYELNGWIFAGGAGLLGGFMALIRFLRSWT